MHFANLFVAHGLLANADKDALRAPALIHGNCEPTRSIVH